MRRTGWVFRGVVGRSGKSKLPKPAVLFLMMCVLIAGAGLAKEKHAFDYSLRKDTPLRYRTSTQIATTQEMMGMAFETKAVLDVVTTLTLAERQANGNFSFILKHESFRAKIHSPRVDSTLVNPAGLVGKRVLKTVTRHGDQVASKELDAFTVPPLLPGFATDQEFLANLPEQPLAIGESVEVADTDTTHAFGGENISKSNVTYTLAGLDTLEGRSCLRLEVEGGLTLEGTGSFRGMSYFLEGDGRVEGKIYFAPESGIVVRAGNSVDIEMTIAFTGEQSMTIPTTQHIEMKMELEQ